MNHVRYFLYLEKYDSPKKEVLLDFHEQWFDAVIGKILCFIRSHSNGEGIGIILISQLYFVKFVKKFLYCLARIG